MTFSEYQKEAAKTAVYPNRGHDFIYPTLGLAGEAGEVAGKVSKIVRDKNGLLDDSDREALKKELGDVLWYISQLATETSLDLDEIAAHNLEKLLSRQQRDVLHGNGDNR